jgi:hypothetical protein
MTIMTMQNQLRNPEKKVLRKLKRTKMMEKKQALTDLDDKKKSLNDSFMPLLMLANLAMSI